MNTHEASTPTEETTATGPGPATSDLTSGTTTRRAGVAGLAVAAALVSWAVIVTGLGVPLAARAGGAVQQVGAAAVVLGSLVAGLLALGAVAVIARLRPRRARATWTMVGSLVLVVSLVGPLGGLTPAAVVGLVVLHLVVGGVLVLGLRATLPSSTGLR